jgi:hypothetical protein
MSTKMKVDKVVGKSQGWTGLPSEIKKEILRLYIIEAVYESQDVSSIVTLIG